MNSLEESRHHFNRVETGSARNLQNDKKHAEAFTNVLKSDRECVNNVDIYDGFNNSCKDKASRTDTLNSHS